MILHVLIFRIFFVFDDFLRVHGHVSGANEDIKFLRTAKNEISIFAERINLNGNIFVNGKPLGSGGGSSGGGSTQVLIVLENFLVPSNTFSRWHKSALKKKKKLTHFLYIYFLATISHLSIP